MVYTPSARRNMPMPWKETSAMDQRIQLIADWLSGAYTKRELCRAYEISRPTADKWIARYAARGAPAEARRDESRVRSLAPALHLHRSSSLRIDSSSPCSSRAPRTRMTPPSSNQTGRSAHIPRHSIPYSASSSTATTFRPATRRKWLMFRVTNATLWARQIPAIR